MVSQVYNFVIYFTDQLDGDTSLQSEVFASIIAMCFERILCRLRLRANNRNMPRQSVKKCLQETISALQAQAAKEGMAHTVKIFEDRAKSVSKLIDAWSNHQTSNRLGEIVVAMYQLSKVENLSSLLNDIPDRSMNPNSRKNLLNIIQKVARYWQAARFLYRSARKFPLVRHMAIIFASLPERAFNRALHDQSETPLSSKLSTFHLQDKLQVDEKAIAQYLRLSQYEISTTFTTQARKTLEEAKIHAEIQILYHCELYTSKLPPRVIGSSKDACFLCNTFIKMHEKFHTPRGHGRLYPGWRLPCLTKHDSLQQRFNLTLDDCLQKTLTDIALRKKRLQYPDPNESTLITLHSSQSTLTEQIEGESVVENEEPADISSISANSVENARPTTAPVHAPSTLPEQEALKIQTNENQAPISQKSPEAIIDVGLSSTLSPPLEILRSNLAPPLWKASLEECTLRQGQVDIGSIEANATSAFYTTSELEVQIEYSTRSTEKPRCLGYSVEWLTFEALDRLREHRAVSIVDAEGLDCESTQMDSHGCLYISARNHVLKLSFSFEARRST